MKMIGDLLKCVAIGVGFLTLGPIVLALSEWGDE